MKKARSMFLGTAVVCLGLVATIAGQQAAPKTPAPAPVPAAAAKPAPATSHAPATTAAPSSTISHADQNALIQRYCAGCHNERGKDKVAQLVLTGFDVSKAAQHAPTAEKMIRKLQAGMMPPPGMPRPEPAQYQALINTLETTVDAAAVLNPNPGGRTFPRLNRAEYSRAIGELLDLNVDAGRWLPLDTMSANFDNIADEQALSPTLLESYLNAASDISRMAVGDKNAPAVDSAYQNKTYASQHPWDHVDGTPYGTRGGMVVDHVFPADGQYQFELGLTNGDNSRYEDVDISIDGERVAFLQYENGPQIAADGSGATPLFSESVLVRAGQHKVAAAFVRRVDGPYEDLIRPHEWSNAGGGSGGGGITTLPQLHNLTVRGPLKTTGISMTPSRAKIFSCRPTSSADEKTCARQIVTRMGSEAYRRPITTAEVDRLMPFYDKEAAKNGFEAGVRASLEAVLASPYFIFRLEKAPTDARGGGTYRVADVDLASRLSFFIWGLPPDKDLIAAAGRKELSTPGGLEKYARKMLADPRASAIADRFAAQWLRLQDIEKVRPDPNFYPNFDEGLADAMRTETKMFFNSLVREDRSLLDLYRADYTFVNERLAQHYGIKGITGNEFRRVTITDPSRRGILGEGSMLVQTSMANRTSPVLRGKWVMEVLLGTPPPPPPPDVNTDLDTSAGASKDGRALTTRERMEIHRKNPTCSACHRFMDPIGLSLDNFDVTAKWRERENGTPLDTHGDFYDGTKVGSPSDLVTVLLKRPTPLVRTFTENLMAYGLGRRVESCDQPAVRAIAKAASANDYKMSSFIVGVVKSDAFRMKRVEPEAPATDNSKVSQQ